MDKKQEETLEQFSKRVVGLWVLYMERDTRPVFGKIVGARGLNSREVYVRWEMYLPTVMPELETWVPADLVMEVITKSL